MDNQTGWGQANIGNGPITSRGITSVSARPDSDRVLYVDGLTKDQDLANEMLRSALTRLDGHLTSLLGSEPPRDTNGPSEQIPTVGGRLYGLAEQVRATRSLAEAIHSQLNRLDRI